jgi:hypothetical protein
MIGGRKKLRMKIFSALFLIAPLLLASETGE